eukprot:4217390-Amphidinium_carterae.1
MYVWLPWKETPLPSTTLPCKLLEGTQKYASAGHFCMAAARTTMLGVQLSTRCVVGCDLLPASGKLQAQETQRLSTRKTSAITMTSSTLASLCCMPSLYLQHSLQTPC